MKHGFGVIVLNVPQPCRELLQQRKKPLWASTLDRIPTHSHRDAVWGLECHVWAPLLFVLLAGVLSVDLGFLFWHAQVWVSRHGPAFHPQLCPPRPPLPALCSSIFPSPGSSSHRLSLFTPLRSHCLVYLARHVSRLLPIPSFDDTMQHNQ